MKIKSAKYYSSYVDVKKLPDTSFWEFAFVGRSNVGKSSLLNFITGQTNLAKTSSKPGKTRTFNYFSINDNFFIVDLPGYGYAKFSKTEREKWQKRMFRYFTVRKQLAEVFVLIDSSIPPQAIDINLINFLGEKGIPCAIIFTKTDKAKQNITEKNIKDMNKILLQTWETLPPQLKISVVKKRGKEEILNHIEKTLEDLSKITQQNE